MKRQPEHMPARIGTPEKNGRKIAVGDIVRYMAGSKRHIPQEYLVEDVLPPDIFRAIGHDGRLQFTWVRLFELDKWGEVIGNIDKTPLEVDTASPYYRP